MNDSLGRDIKVGDVVVYGTRHASSQSLNIAIVKEIVTKPRRAWDVEDAQFIRAECVAGTSHEFTHGYSRWNDKTQTHDEAIPVTSRNVTLTAPTLIVINGVDLGAIVGALKDVQQRNANR